MIYMRYIFLLSLVGITIIPFVVLGANSTTVSNTGFVTCNGPDCTFCSVVAMVNKIKDWIIMMSTVLAVLVLAYAGARMVFSQGNPSALADAKQYLINVFIGVLLILAAFTIVDSLMKVLVGGDFGPWNALDPANCGTQFEPGKTDKGGITLSPHENTLQLSDYQNEVETVGYGGAILNTSGTPITSVNLNNLESLSAAGINVANWEGINGPGRTDKAAPQVVSAVKWIQDQGQTLYGKQIFQVTAAYANNVGHSANSMHYKGVAVDLQAINGITNTQIAALARQAGFTYVLDEGNHVHMDMRSLTTAQ